MLAARIIAAYLPSKCSLATSNRNRVDNPADVAVISARPYGQRAVLKFAAHTGATAIAGQ